MSYLRDDTLYVHDSSLPNIRHRACLIDGRVDNKFSSLEDISPYSDADKHVRFTETTNRTSTHPREDSPVFYPRPPSPTHAHNRRQVLEVNI